MPNYKVIYFNAKGRAESIRYVFAQAGVKYEDVRVTGEEFGKMKPSLPAGSLPVLEVDGERLSGSGEITRYLAEKFGLAGANEWENAQLASIMDVLSDLQSCVIPVFWGKDDAAKAEAKKKLLEESIPKYFGGLEKRIKANNSPGGWAYGNKITYVDMKISLTLDRLLGLDPAVGDAYPTLKKLSDMVKEQPKIAEWIKNRPETNF